MHKQVYETRVLLGQDLMRSRHPDYDDMEAAATEVAQANPQLRQAILSHPNPAQYTYEVGKRIRMQQEVQRAGGWDSYYAQTLNSHVEAEVARRLADQAGGSTPRAPAVRPTSSAPARSHPSAPPPQSLARTPSATPGSKGPGWQGPASLEDILK
jgi:hypothetical protein